MAQIEYRGQKSPGFCPRCNAHLDEEDRWGHKPKNCRNPPFCPYHDTFGHAPTYICQRVCAYCRERHHTMQFCRKLKNCVLCGKTGHNPKWCWKWDRISDWLHRAEKLGRCGECLTLFKTDATKCTNCNKDRAYWSIKHQAFIPVPNLNCEESQTEENSNVIQECQTELQEGKTMIEELKNKILSLENKLESSNATIDDLNWKLQCIKKEKERELHKVNELDLLCKQKEMELKKLWEKIAQKDTELEQHRKRSAQPSQTAPAAAQQHCPSSAQQHCPSSAQQHCPASGQQPCPASDSSNLGHFNIPNYIKPTLIDLQDQQQKLYLMVNQLYNKIMTPNISWLNYSNLNPNMGLYDTGQYFR